MGAILASQANDGAEAYGLVLFTKVLGWSEEKARDVIAKAAASYKDRRIHTQNDQYVSPLVLTG